MLRSASSSPRRMFLHAQTVSEESSFRIQGIGNRELHLNNNKNWTEQAAYIFMMRALMGHLFQLFKYAINMQSTSGFIL